MISQLSTKSVVIAERTIFFSRPASSSGACPAASSLSSCASTQPSFSKIFSAPSKHRYVPPTMRRGVSSHGRN